MPVFQDSLLLGDSLTQIINSHKRLVAVCAVAVYLMPAINFLTFMTFEMGIKTHQLIFLPKVRLSGHSLAKI